MKTEDIRIKVENSLRKLNHRNEAIKNTSAIYIGENGKKYQTTKRVMEEVEMPIGAIPSDEEVFGRNGLPNHKFIEDHFRKEGKLSEDQLIRIIRDTASIMREEPNLIYVDTPATVVGDIHGQFYDLLELLTLGGSPSKGNYIFLGDYVDRGDRSIEVLILFYAMKLNFPEKIVLLRGNHETYKMTSYFTFLKECETKYSIKLYKEAVKSFKCLPLCAVLNQQFFCVHGGISSSLWDLNEINQINRFLVDPPNTGIFCDLLWSDPSNEYDEEEDGSVEKLFTFNYERHCSEFYSYYAVESFLEHNNLLSVIRGHQPQDSGYRMYKVNESTGFPSLITIFSAPNYCGTYKNMAAILKYDGESFNIKQFESSPAPYCLPNQMNVFEWSLPFVSEKVLEILSAVLNICTDDELNHTDIELSDINWTQRGEPETIVQTNENDENSIGNINLGKNIHKKLIAVGRMTRMLNLLRQEKETVDRIKLFNRGKLPNLTLVDGREQLHQQLQSFKEVRAMDLENEALPPSEEEISTKQKQREEEFEQIS